MNWKRLIIGLPGLLIAIPAIYILASFVGALVPGNIVSHSADAAESKIKHIYLLTSPLHADIAIPVDAEVLQNFSFLKDSGIDLEQPGLRYLIFGWGSKEFYTTAGSYADIIFSATFKAITGDTSVMHVVPSGQLVANDNSTKIDMSSPGFARLITRIMDKTGVFCCRRISYLVCFF